MRELKFRAWDKSVEHLYEVQTLIDGGGSIGRYVLNGEMRYIHLCADEIIVEQYTGLKDKNGKEIYEGDIIQTNRGARAIGWNNEYSRYGFHESRDGYYAFCKLSNFEVIGNIHENPELLEEEE